MLNSLKVYLYFYIITLPFTLFLTQIIDFDIEKPLGFLLINILAALSVFTYYKKIKPLFGEEKTKSKVNLLLGLFIGVIILLLFHISSELRNVYGKVSDIPGIEDKISDIENKASDIENELSDIKNDITDIHDKIIYRY